MRDVKDSEKAAIKQPFATAYRVEEVDPILIEGDVELRIYVTNVSYEHMT